MVTIPKPPAALLLESLQEKALLRTLAGRRSRAPRKPTIISVSTVVQLWA